MGQVLGLRGKLLPSYGRDYLADMFSNSPSSFSADNCYAMTVVTFIAVFVHLGLRHEAFS